MYESALTDSKSVQRFLAGKGLYKGAIDGDFRTASIEAARRLLSLMGSPWTSYRPDWPDARVRIAAEQAMFESIGLELGTVDGSPGPRTQHALREWQDHITFDRPSPDPTAGIARAPLWPLQSEMAQFYGAPGTGHTRISAPYPIYFNGQPVRSYLIHERCAESRLRIYERTLAEYGLDEIVALGLDQFGGCYNNRTMRGGRAISTHAYACAEDWDAARNPLRATSATAQMAKPDYAPFLDAFEAEGWVSLGRARNFDWMHLQAARL